MLISTDLIRGNANRPRESAYWAEHADGCKYVLGSRDAKCQSLSLSQLLSLVSRCFVRQAPVPWSGRRVRRVVMHTIDGAVDRDVPIAVLGSISIREYLG